MLKAKFVPLVFSPKMLKIPYYVKEIPCPIYSNN